MKENTKLLKYYKKSDKETGKKKTNRETAKSNKRLKIPSNFSVQIKIENHLRQCKAQ